MKVYFVFLHLLLWCQCLKARKNFISLIGLRMEKCPQTDSWTGVESLLITWARAELMLHESFRTSMFIICFLIILFSWYAGNTLLPQFILLVMSLSARTRAKLPQPSWLWKVHLYQFDSLIMAELQCFKGKETCHLRC